jgi:hypothetical protein
MDPGKKLLIAVQTNGQGACQVQPGGVVVTVGDLTGDLRYIACGVKGCDGNFPLTVLGEVADGFHKHLGGHIAVLLIYGGDTLHNGAFVIMDADGNMGLIHGYHGLVCVRSAPGIDCHAQIDNTANYASKNTDKSKKFNHNATPKLSVPGGENS